MHVLFIRARDGREEVAQLPRRGAVAAIAVGIDADSVGTVDLRDGRVMIIGHDPGRKTVNATATALYHQIPGISRTEQIVGDVAIMRDEDFVEADAR